MLGYGEISLGEKEYAVQIKKRLESEVQGIGNDLKIADASGEGYLTCAGIYADAFSQDGHNGGDYLIVVPDEVLVRMQPFYSELTADLKDSSPEGLAEKLYQAMPGGQREAKYYRDASSEGNNCLGSDNIISYTEDVLVREQTIRKQLTAYYLCPAFLAALIRGKMILQVSEIFVRETGVPTMAGMYFAVSMALFFGIYLMYFLVTYIGFKRNVEGKQTVRGPGA